MERILLPALYYNYHHHLPFGWQQVVRLDADRNYTIFSLADGRKHVTTKTIGLYAQCVPNAFVRVHKGCIINQAFLIGLSHDHKQVLLSNGTASKIARRRVSTLIEIVHS